MPRTLQELVLPRVEEQITIAKREISRERVRIAKTVETHEVEVEPEAVKEDVEIERVPVNRYVLEAPQPRLDGDVMIIPVVEEIVVVEKRLLLKEEIRVRKHRHVVRKKLRVPVRRERIAIERTRENTNGEKRRPG